MQRNIITQQDLFPSSKIQADSLHKIVAYFDLTASKKQYQETDIIWLLRKSNESGFLSLTSMPYSHYRRHFEGRSKRDYSARLVREYGQDHQQLYDRWRLYPTNNGWKFISIFTSQKEQKNLLAVARKEKIEINDSNSNEIYQSLAETLQEKRHSLEHQLTPLMDLTPRNRQETPAVDYVQRRESKSLALYSLLRQNVEELDPEESSEENSAEKAQKFLA